MCFKPTGKKQIICVRFIHTVSACFLCDVFPTVCYKPFFSPGCFANMDDSVINIRRPKSTFTADHVIVLSRGVNVSKKYSHGTDRFSFLGFWRTKTRWLWDGVMGQNEHPAGWDNIKVSVPHVTRMDFYHFWEVYWQTFALYRTINSLIVFSVAYDSFKESSFNIFTYLQSKCVKTDSECKMTCPDD